MRNRVMLIILFLCLISFCSSVSDSSSVANPSGEQQPVKAMFIMISNLTSGLLGALVVLVIGEILRHKRDKKDLMRNYITSLNVVRDEIEFYCGKFEYLQGHNELIQKDLRNGASPSIPTFSFYPDHIGRIKQDLCTYRKNSGIIKQVTKCHFELNHISERLNHQKDILRSEYDSELMIQNIEGFNILINNGIKLFTEAIEVLNKEILEVSK